MQEGHRIWQDCSTCLATGKMYLGTTSEHPVNENSKQSTVNYTEIDCTACDGLGIRPWGWMVKDEVGTMPGGTECRLQ